MEMPTPCPRCGKVGELNHMNTCGTCRELYCPRCLKTPWAECQVCKEARK